MDGEPFDLDATDATDATDEADEVDAGRAPRAVAVLRTLALVLVAATASAAVTSGQVRRDAVATRRAHDRAQVSLVATGGQLVSSRAAPTTADGARHAVVVVSVDLVNAGPTTLALLDLHAGGAAAPLTDAFAEDQPLPPAQTATGLLFGIITCPAGRQVVAERARVRVRSADGRTTTRLLGSGTDARWTAALQRACAVPVATP